MKWQKMHQSNFKMKKKESIASHFRPIQFFFIYFFQPPHFEILESEMYPINKKLSPYKRKYTALCSIVELIFDKLSRIIL